MSSSSRHGRIAVTGVRHLFGPLLRLAPRNRRSTFAGSGVSTAIAAVAALALVPVALSSLLTAVVCVGVVALVLLTLVLGAARVGAVMLLLAFGLVTFDNVHVTGSIRIAHPFFILAFLLLLPHFAASPLRMPTQFVVGAVGFSALGLVSAVISDAPAANLSYLFQVLRGVIFLPILLVWWRPKETLVIAAACSYVLGNCVNVVAALINGPSGGGRYSGLSSAPNLLGYGAALSLSLVPFLVATLSRRLRWVVFVLAAACAYGVYISGSRGALLGAIALAVLYPLLVRSIPAALGIAALIAPAMVLISNAMHDPSSSNSLGRLLGGESGQASNDARLQGAQAGFDQLIGHPVLGDGWLTIWGAHIGYLQIAAAIGLFGLAFYLILLFSVLRPLLTVPSPYRLLAVPALTAAMLDLVLPVVGAMFEWSAVGLALCAAPLAARQSEQAEEGLPSSAQAPG